MSETCFQLDMTSFYSAEAALRALSAGRSPGAPDPTLRIGIPNLALIFVASLFYDQILVPVPAVLDRGIPRKDFGPSASLLARELLSAGVVSVLNLDPPSKESAIHQLEALAKEYRLCTADFFQNLGIDKLCWFKEWAEGQLDNKGIVQNTRDEEGVSEFHRSWTVDQANAVIHDLKGLSNVTILSACPQKVLTHIVTTVLRGFIYETCGFKHDTYYLPHFVREGLLGHTRDPRVQARLAQSVAHFAASEEELAGVFEQSRNPPSDIPMRIAFLEKLQANKDFRPEAVAATVRRERETSDNIKLREKLRETTRHQDLDLRIEQWHNVLLRDREVWQGQRLPPLFERIPQIIQVFPGVNPEKVRAMLEALPGIRSSARLWQKLRTPIYLSKHMRYLWRHITTYSNGQY